MEKYFLPYDLSMEFKELGFDEECIAGYYNGTNFKIETAPWVGWYKLTCLVPLISQAKKFLREKYNLLIVIDKYENPNSYGYLIYDENFTENCGYKAYEEAELEAIRECIKIIKNEQEKTL